jgi:hypothetical protein
MCPREGLRLAESSLLQLQGKGHTQGFPPCPAAPPPFFRSLDYSPPTFPGLSTVLWV